MEFGKLGEALVPLSLLGLRGAMGSALCSLRACALAVSEGFVEEVAFRLCYGEWEGLVAHVEVGRREM